MEKSITQSKVESNSHKDMQSVTGVIISTIPVVNIAIFYMVRFRAPRALVKQGIYDVLFLGQ